MGAGTKQDAGKPRWDLLPWREVGQVVRVLTKGAVTYAPFNWQRIENPRDRYFAAAHRHLAAWQSGKKRDFKTRLPHLSHAVCCLLFLMWFDNQKDGRNGKTGNRTRASRHR